MIMGGSVGFIVHNVGKIPFIFKALVKMNFCAMVECWYDMVYI